MYRISWPLSRLATVQVARKYGTCHKQYTRQTTQKSEKYLSDDSSSSDEPQKEQKIYI
jgi:hypothetical protein